MKHLNKYLSLALALVLCLSLAACGESNEDYGDDGSDYNLYGVPDSFEGLVKDSEQMSNLYLYGGAWKGEDGGTLISDTNDDGDEGEGMGLYLYDNGTRAYLCPGDDGNSFTLSAERFGRYGDDQHFDGVFYRNADFYAYTDMENAEFYEDEYSIFYIWYYDGVNRYLLGNDYTIGEDGLAYHDEDGLIYPAGWIPEEPYDPAVDWGANWMDSWDI